jgi:hypothetical protein
VLESNRDSGNLDNLYPGGGTVELQRYPKNSTTFTPFNLGAGQLFISKSINLVGIQYASGDKPIIKNNSSSGVIEVEAPGKSVELNNLEIQSDYDLVANNEEYARDLTPIIRNYGSSSFRILDCKVIGNEKQNGLNVGIGCHGYTFSELPTIPSPPAPFPGIPNPNNGKQFNVTGEIIIRNSEVLDTAFTGIAIGWAGPVYELNYVEVSGCTIDPFGSGEAYNKGNAGFLISQYPYYFLFPGFLPGYPSSLRVDATTASATMNVAGNTMTAAQPFSALNVKGTQDISGNTINSWGYNYWQGLLWNIGMHLSHHPDDPTAYATIIQNDMDFSVPDHPGTTLTFTLPPPFPPIPITIPSPVLSCGFYLGLEPESIIPFPIGSAQCTLADNILTTSPYTGKTNAVNYGIRLMGTANNCTITHNDTRDLLASAQATVGINAYNNEFKNNDYGIVDLSSGPAGFIIHGDGNKLVNENFWGGYPGLPDVPCLWLSEGTQGNTVTALKNGQNLQGMDLCYQILNEGNNYISGYDKCQNVPQHVIDNMRRKECVILGGTWKQDPNTQEWYCVYPPEGPLEL